MKRTDSIAPPATSFDLEDRRIRELVRGLHTAKPRVYWSDLLVTTALGWAAFALAVAQRPFSPGMWGAVAVAVLALYRALLFIHEISHQGARSLPGFEATWNFLVGYPMLIPSCVYAGVHQSHHGLGTYGTALDPEYLPFARSSRMTVVFALESFLIPVVLVVRFLLLTPVGLVWPPFQKWLVVHLSSLTMNLEYRRDATPEIVRMVRRQTTGILFLWAAFFALWLDGILPFRVFGIWLLVSSLVSFINTLRTLGAHAYESSGAPLDRMGQLVDSIDTPGAVWTELWAPVGLRYHALHHYFPGIPYHNLPEAWKKVSVSLPPEAFYHRVRSPGLARSLRSLYRKGQRRPNR
ncbi:MAG: fatty acid desaturase [Acidobacteriota bacterium]